MVGRGWGRSLGNIWMETRRDGKGVAIGVEHWRTERLRALVTGLLGSWKAEGFGDGFIGELEG